jgi:hypothetical protein
MRRIGRLLQVAGLVLLPVSMALEMSGAGGEMFGTREMLVMLLFGVAAFYFGRIIEGYSRA